MTAFAIELDRVSKRYAVGDRRGLLSWPPAAGAANARNVHWAVREVSLHVAPGESVGLIGHNGAGKTTLLRLLAGITRPSSGRVRTNGRVASLINLGAGFHPELSGRENVELNGVILGLSRREVLARFDEIVDFADLGDYIDTPLKRYSAGMVARLGFAVAAFVEPDVMLVDEVLSVGDIGFQDRSIRKMLSFRDSGQTVLFVSHNLSAVEMMCQRTVWLDRGVVRQAGPTQEVVRAYLDAVDQELLHSEGVTPGSNGARADAGHGAAAQVQTLDPEALSQTDSGARTQPGRPAIGRQGDGAEQLVITRLSISDLQARATTDFEFGDGLQVTLHCLARLRTRGVRCTLTVRGDYGPLFSANSDSFEVWEPGVHEITCVFEHLPLLPGLYRLEAELDHAGAPTWDKPRSVTAFRVITDLAEYGSDSLVGATKSRGGFLAVGYNWTLRTQNGEQHLPGLRLPRKMATSRPP